MKTSLTKAALRSATCIAAFAIGTTGAYAQDADASSDAGEAIIVTGSRLNNASAEIPAPVQVVSSEQIQSTGAINIQETLLRNPVFGTPTFSRTNSSFNTSGSGLATVDLRNLGIDRTLTLINGRRVVSGVPGSSAVDLNMIPTEMLSRVEVLTSGSGSAIYGSDAVAGVVNFIVQDDFEGLDLGLKSGISEVGDNFQLDTYVKFGGNFADGRGNITAYFGYTEQGSAYMRNHKTEQGRSDTDSLSEIFYYPLSPGDDGFDPKTVFMKNSPGYSSYAPGGTYFAGDDIFTYSPITGQLQPCRATNGSTATCDGPTGFNRSAYRYLAIPLQRYSAFVNGHYDVTDGLTAYFEGQFVSTNAKSNIEPFPFDTEAAYIDGQMPIETMYNGGAFRNPYVPDAIFDAATDTNGDGLRDVYISKRLTSFGPRRSESTQNTFRLVGGLKGEITTNWNFDVFANYGQSNVTQNGTGQINVMNFAAANQIIPDGNGGYRCADDFADAMGCVPANFFGEASLSPEAVAYLEAPSNYTAVQKQTQIGGNIAGYIMNPLGANEIGLTVGAEYRREAQSDQWDALQTLGLNGGNALPPTSGSFDVKEAFGEVVLPLVTDTFVHDLTVRGAVRFSDYSTVGSTFSWNVGGEFAPIQDIRFRATYAVTVRAPNISELYAGRSQTFPTVIDPCQGVGLTGDAPNGASGDLCRAAPGVLANINANNGTFVVSQLDRQGVTGFSGGNPNLSEEKGKTFTAGVVINPVSVDALRNLRLSVDYFHVEVEDAIVTTPRNYILNQCYTVGELCDFIVRRPAAIGANSAGSLDEVNTAVTNSGGLVTSGIDVALDYTHYFPMGGSDLRANINFAYSHLIKGYEVPLATQPENRNPFAGEVGAAKDRFTTTVGVGMESWRLTATGTYIGASWIDDQFFDEAKVAKVHPEFYLNLQARFFLQDKKYEFYVGADNVLDNSPIYMAGVSGAVTGMESDTGTYDPLGRRFYAGIKAHF